MNKNILFLILAFGLIVRLYRINIPLLEFYPSRQIQTADITRNFIFNDFNIFNPTVTYLGPGYSRFLIEFPGYNLIVAAFYKLLGVNEIYGRLVSIAFWVFSLYFIYKIAYSLVSKNTGLFAVFFYSLSPLSILVSRSFQPDQMMITFSVASIFFMTKFRGTRYLFYFASAFMASIAILTKAPAAIFTIIPVLFLISQKSKRIKSDAFFFVFYALLPSLLWYFYSFIQNSKGLQTEVNFSFSNWFGPELFLNWKFYSTIFGFEYGLSLLPVGIFLFTFGLFSFTGKNKLFFLSWLSAVVLYFLIFNKHTITHEYYHLPFLPLASIYIGIALEKVTKGKSFFLVGLLTVSIILVMLPPTLERAYKPIDRFKYVKSLGKTIEKITRKNDLVIGSMDGGPSLVYYSKRNGWGFNVDRDKVVGDLNFYGFKTTRVNSAVEELEELRQKGAIIFATAYKNQFLGNSQFSEYMYLNYKVIEEDKNSVIFDLRKN